MTANASNGRPAWSIHPSDINRMLKAATSRCHRLIGVARRDGNQPVVDAFSIVLGKIKDAQHALRDARAAYGWESSVEDVGTDGDTVATAATAKEDP